MKQHSILAACFLLSSIGFASDHNNLDQERPLAFEDAFSIAYRSLEFQNGMRFLGGKGRNPVYGLRSELQYGFAKNRDFSIGFEPTYDSSTRNVTSDRLELSYFEGLRREIDDCPALGYRLEARLPMNSSQRGTEIKFRGILTKTARQYDKLHLNLDVVHNTDSEQVDWGGIIGYSTPIGYPKRFDKTLLVELGSNQQSNWLGVGLRKQVSVTGVLDIGLQSEFGARNPNSRLVVGYSVNY